MTNPGSPRGANVRTFLQRLRGNAHLYHNKWRNHVLLITHADWFLEASSEGMVPFAVRKELRERAAANDGFLPFGELQRVAAQLHEQQLLTLRNEFPVFEG